VRSWSVIAPCSSDLLKNAAPAAGANGPQRAQTGPLLPDLGRDLV